MKLHDDYSHPVESALATMAFVESTNDRGIDAEYDDGDALFMMLCRGLRMYVEAWSDTFGSGGGGLAVPIVDLDDIENPDRIQDPHAQIRTLIRLAVESLTDNVEVMYDDPDLGKQP